MHWLQVVDQHLDQLRPSLGRKIVTCAIVEQTPAPRKLRTTWYPGWRVEDRHTPRGNIALHLFPSAS